MLWASRSNRPDLALGAIHGEAAEERHAQGVDAVAQQAEQRGQQDERGEQRRETTSITPMPMLMVMSSGTMTMPSIAERRSCR